LNNRISDSRISKILLLFNDNLLIYKHFLISKFAPEGDIKSGISNKDETAVGRF
jgi:hypothetical protein